jgi:hypothetical protein
MGKIATKTRIHQDTRRNDKKNILCLGALVAKKGSYDEKF